MTFKEVYNKVVEWRNALDFMMRPEIPDSVKTVAIVSQSCYDQVLGILREMPEYEQMQKKASNA